jgi:two-component system chemotaxis response regulator CheB
MLKKILKNKKSIEIIGEASNPIDSFDILKEVGIPDVFILDIEMPKMDGVEFLKKLKEERPTPTIIFSSLVSEGSTKSIQALGLGACDIVAKPKNINEVYSEEFIEEFVTKIIAASSSKHMTYDISHSKISNKSKRSSFEKVIAIGASTGGVQTIEAILSKLKPNHPPIVITQHMPVGFTKSFAYRLNSLCLNSEIKEATQNDVLERGKVFIAPGNLHLEVKKEKNNGYFINLEDYPKVSNHKPSVDVLFNSVSKEVGSDAISFILTGMGKDGALGMKKIKESGGQTYGQDKESSIVYGMPKAAYELGSVETQVNINKIIDIINNLK